MKSSELARFLNRPLFGEDIDVQSFSSLANIVQNTVVFAKKYSVENEALINSKRVFALVCDNPLWKLTSSHVISANPRLDYMRIISNFFLEREIPVGIHPSAFIEEGAFIGNGVSIGAHCYVGKHVSIGDGTVIMPNTSIYGKVKIGRNCYIKAGVSIGGPGFGFEYDENKVPVHFPHTGEIIIGNNVYIGGNTVIDRGTIDATIIEDNVKIDNLVSVGHNSHIKENALVIGGTMIGGGVEIGKNAWIATGSTIIQKIKIGDNSKVGLGAVVLRDVEEGTVVFGNPAKRIIAPKVSE